MKKQTRKIEIDTRDLVFHPATPERWGDLRSLFDGSGETRNCYCMYWRLKRSEFNSGLKDGGNQRALQALINTGIEPGLMAYYQGKAIGWVSVGPRQDYSTLQRSRILKPVDSQVVWSVVCFYVLREYRRQQVTVALLKAAVRFATEHGARIIEGYPIDPKDENYPDGFAYHGLMNAFVKAGFTEVARGSEKRPIMRYGIV